MTMAMTIQLYNHSSSSVHDDGNDHAIGNVRSATSDDSQIT